MARSSSGFSEYGDHVFDGHDEQVIVTFKVDRNGVLWIKQNLVVLLDGKVRVARYLSGDGHDPTGDGRDFNIVGKLDAAASLFFIRILADEHALAHRLNGFQ